MMYQGHDLPFQDYTITIYLNQYWTDDRLAFSKHKNRSETMTLTGDFAEKIWVPDTFFANDKYSFLHDVTDKNKMVRLHGDGFIAYGMRRVSVHSGSVCNESSSRYLSPL